MKRALLIAACCLFFAGMQAQAAEEQKWATSPLAAVASLGELNLQAPTAVDNAGNVFATGQFTQPISIGSAFLEPIANSAYLAKYDAVDINVYDANIFHTKMMVKEIDLQNYLFKTDAYELPPTVRLEIMDNLRKEMIEIFSGRNVF